MAEPNSVLKATLPKLQSRLDILDALPLYRFIEVPDLVLEQSPGPSQASTQRHVSGQLLLQISGPSDQNSVTLHLEIISGARCAARAPMRPPPNIHADIEGE